jgi:hypothetical protein
MYVCRQERVTTSRSISASTATMSSALSMRSRRVASGWSTWPKSTAGCSSTTSHSASTPKRSRGPDTEPRSYERSPRRCRRCSAPVERRWTSAGPAPTVAPTKAVVLVSNDQYRLGRALGSGTRPRLDAGVLGVTALGAGAATGDEKRVQKWTTGSFEVHSDGPVAAGIDGEALKLDPPLRFRSRPQALRVLIAPQHPGASPSATMPKGPGDAIGAVARIAIRGSS